MDPSNHWQILSRLSGIGALRRLPHWRERSNQGTIEKRADALGVEKKNKRTVQLRCLDLFRIGSSDKLERGTWNMERGTLWASTRAALLDSPQNGASPGLSEEIFVVTYLFQEFSLEFVQPTEI
jgi:hypothetical protein